MNLILLRGAYYFLSWILVGKLVYDSIHTCPSSRLRQGNVIVPHVRPLSQSS